MFRLTSLALGLAVFAAPASAQISGSINGDAPKVSTTIAFANGEKIEVSYTAIHFGQGAWLEMKDNERMIERLNALAERKPIGSVNTTVGCKVAGRDVPAGKYAMYFTANADAGWILNLKDGDKDPIRWRLVTSELKSSQKRLTVALAPGDESDSASVSIKFGNMGVTVPVATTRADKKGN